MFPIRKILSTYVVYSWVSAAVYSIPMICFFRLANYTESWILYIGNALFIVCVAISIISYNKKLGGNTRLTELVVAGHTITLIAIVISCLIILLLLFIYVPNIFDSLPAEKILKQAPANMGAGKTDGLVFALFVNATMVNFIAGSFASIVTSVSAKGNQKSETGTTGMQ